MGFWRSRVRISPARFVRPDGVMKRDLELIRLLLLRTESGGIYIAACEQYDVATRAYHVDLMKQEGLVDAVVSNDSLGRPAKAAIKSITSKGHDYLDSIRATQALVPPGER